MSCHVISSQAYLGRIDGAPNDSLHKKTEVSKESLKRQEVFKSPMISLPCTHFRKMPNHMKSNSVSLPEWYFLA